MLKSLEAINKFSLKLIAPPYKASHSKNFSTAHPTIPIHISE